MKNIENIKNLNKVITKFTLAVKELYDNIKDKDCVLFYFVQEYAKLNMKLSSYLIDHVPDAYKKNLVDKEFEKIIRSNFKEAKKG